ncbi:hypothetical protein JEZ13_11035 [bacterium]|nr:hypothetical protein [bacterium]
MKRSILFLIGLLIIIGLSSTEIPYSAPEFMQAYYDAYSNNYINTLASGRGNTGVAKIENVENVLLNPAGFSTDHTEMYIEFLIKPEQKEIGHLGEENYLSNKPFSFVGFGFNFVDQLSSAIYYSMPKSIEYQRYTIDLEAGTIFDRKPKYNHYSFGFANSYEFYNLRVGFDANYNIHSISDMFINGALAKINIKEGAFNFNTGLLYSVNDRLNLGASYNHNYEIDFNTDYWDWEVTVPAKVTAGISYYYLKDSIVNFDYERRMNSQMSEHYDDLNIYKIGLEQQIRNNIIRFGAMHIPSTFSGDVRIPYVDIPEAAYDQTANNYNNGIETIKNNKQTFLTIGYTLNMEELTFNLSGMQAIASEIKTTQLSLSIGVNLTDFDITKYTPKSQDED